MVGDAAAGAACPEAASDLAGIVEERWPLSRLAVTSQAEIVSDLLVAGGVRKVYRTATGEVEALRGLDLRVGEGDFVAVMGPSVPARPRC